MYIGIIEEMQRDQSCLVRDLLASVKITATAAMIKPVMRGMDDDEDHHSWHERNHGLPTRIISITIIRIGDD